jgi:hypothetical protein
VHFYYPIPDTRELSGRRAWDHMSEMPGVNWDPAAQLDWVRNNLSTYGGECRWPEPPDYERGSYGWTAPTFGYCSAMFAHAVVRYEKPRRIVEVGCGWSTTILISAAEVNEAEGAPPVEYTGIDPYPPAYLANLPGLPKVLASPVQEVPLETLTSLGAGDILFIDSSHVLNVGSDVQRLYLEVLPRLAAGVIVHIHDVQLPYEYPREYAEKQGWFWNEQYLLQALLIDNMKWEILVGGFALCREAAAELQEVFPEYDPKVHGETGSFWMRRR